MTKVFFRQASYEYRPIRSAIFEMLDASGDLGIVPRAKVLIKPNLLQPASPQKAVTTHPYIVRAVAVYALRKGATVLVSDSPAMGPFERVWTMGGYKAVLKDLKVQHGPFKAKAKVDVGRPFGTIDVAREVLEADVVINLAKLKTHMQMLLTLGVKNMFGCIVGLMKPQWHLRAGVDRDKFARLLVQLYQALQPAMTIVDGVLALEGQGPGKSGTPRPLGILVGSRSAWATDRMICKALGLEPEKLPTLRVAQAMGLIPQDEIYIKGDFHIIHDFNLPVLKPLTYGPPYLHQFMRKHLLQKPVVNPQVCILCGKCQQYCPARVIEQDRAGVRFDYDRCIRCYCCVEVCPEGAIRVIEPLAGKIVNKVIGTKP